MSHDINNSNNEYFRKFEILRHLSECAEKESDRMWSRYTFFSYLNTGFIGVIGVFPSQDRAWAIILFSTLGLIASFSWLKIITLSFFIKIDGLKISKRLFVQNQSWSDGSKPEPIQELNIPV